MIIPKVTVDTRELHEAITRAARDSSRTLSEIVNTKLLYICRSAIRHTLKASRDVIKDLINRGELLPRIINKRRSLEGLPALNTDEMLKAEKKEIGRRLRSVGFIAHSWGWAVAQIIPYVKESVVTIRKGGSVKGGARPAPRVGTYSNQTIVASAWNDVEGGKEESAFVTAIKQEGLQIAINEQTESTWEHIADKEFQKKVCDRFNR